VLGSMKIAPFKILGLLLFAFEGLILCVLLNPYLSPMNTDSKVRLRIGQFLIISALVGVGLMYSRKWAAVILSLLFATLAARLYYLSYTYRWEEQLIGVSLAILFLIPLATTIKYWSALRAGGKWYL
jgi:hypothetical protein